MPTSARTHQPKRMKGKRMRRFEAQVIQAMYNTRWRRYSARRLKEFPLCEDCIREGRPRLGSITDHVIPHRGDERLFWNDANHQTLCKVHHDRKTATEDGGFGNARKPRALERMDMEAYVQGRGGVS